MCFGPPSRLMRDAVVGFLVAIEGIDGSGKGTQAERLVSRLTSEGIKTSLVSFPRYTQTTFGARVGEFLNGRFGALDEVDPFLAALLYAGDRFESRDHLAGLLATHEIVVCDRFVASNIAHQGAKRTADERERLIREILTVEHQVFGTPRPDLTVWLDLPVAQAQELIARKARRTYTDSAADLQEADGDYLQSVAEVYEHLAATEPAWSRVAGCQDGELRTVDDVGEDIFQRVHREFRRHRVMQESAVTNGSGPCPKTFAELVESRRKWLGESLEAWSRQATLAELVLAERDWINLAGQVDPARTLWRWAWSRFTALVHPRLGFDESARVRVTLHDGREFVGHPDGRKSSGGELFLHARHANSDAWEDVGPVRLDEIARVEAISG